MVSLVLFYHISKLFDRHDRYRQSFTKLEDNRPIDLKIWSHDPQVMQGLAGVRARRLKDAPDVVKLMEINFNDSCFGFIWSKFHLSNISTYQVEITNLKVPSMMSITKMLSGTDVELVQCNLNVSTPYQVRLTAFGENPGSKETAAGIMWTTHQTPPPPQPPKIISVTETTITLTLPEVTLTEGPLTAIEVRIKRGEGATPLTESSKHSSVWTRMFGRHKRNSEKTDSSGFLLRTVELPYSMIESVNNRIPSENMQYTFRSRDGGNKKIVAKIVAGRGSLLDWEAKVISHDNEMKKGGKQIRNAKVKFGRKGEKVETSVPVMGTTVRMSHHLQEKTLLIFNQVKRERKNNEQVLRRRTFRVNMPTDSKHHDSIPADDSRRHDIYVISEPDLHLDRVNTGSSWLQPYEDVATPIRKSTFQYQTHSPQAVPLGYHQYVTESGRQVSFLHTNGSDIIWLETDIARNLNMVYDISRSNMMSDLFQSASPEADIELLQQLMRNMEDILNSNTSTDDSHLDVLHLLSVASDRQSEHDWNVTNLIQDITEATLLSYLQADSSPGMSSEITTKMIEITKEARVKGSGQFLPMVANEQLKTLTRRKRSVLGFARKHYQKKLGPGVVREIEDGLEVDPYQTRQVEMPVSGQARLVKTGYGYFISDHYGARQPYFGNKKLERCLLRYARYQEARDFILYGKSLLNSTNLTELDLSALYLRVNKVIEVNRMRRQKLFLDMFEDFLFWNQDKQGKQIGGDEVPPAAKLGLPPGVPVARVTTNLAQNLTVGDTSLHDGIPNPPLEPGQEYEVIITLLSTLADVTKHSWSSVNVTTLPEKPEIVPTYIKLLLEIIVVACLLVLLPICCMLWCSRQRRTMTPIDVRLQTNADRAVGNGQLQDLSYADYYIPADHNYSSSTSEQREQHVDTPSVFQVPELSFNYSRSEKEIADDQERDGGDEEE